ncbi:MAG TPA: DUF305 domain-containing protein [Gemmatimonadales bacterium]|nr:DUF305 domain-containing protein [Gemmatimonadales bacterium]
MITFQLMLSPYSRTAHLVSARLSATALATLALILTRPADACAQHDMSAMGGHHPIVIPAGAGYTRADVEFMQGMIAHHGQAIYMSRLAKGHQADPRLQKLAVKIDQSQVAEIRIMQDWLSQRGQFVPDTAAWRTMTMPGMLTAAQLDSLNAGTGTAFDRAYLRFMIQHHEGALQMVRDLFATSNAGQEVDVNVFANDVVAVQTAEIGALQRMLAQLPTE